jgi:shikimate 5-dehydrogenase
MSEESDKIDPQEFAWALRGMPCIGGAISRDIKQSIIPFLDELDPLARDIRSVNTVIRSGKILKGYNTDAIGFMAAIESGMGPNMDTIKSVVCYGYGGVTNVVAHIFKKLGKKVYITGRRPDMVIKKAEELSVSVWTADARPDMFINAAPVSDGPLEEVPFFLDAIKGCRYAFDHEMPGKSLNDYCRLNGIALIKGVEMYLPQMFAQWEMFLSDFTDVSNLESLLQESGMLIIESW